MRIAAIACFMAVVGGVSLAMVGVLVARFYSWVTGCPYVAELPACDWGRFAAIGGLIGAVTLPALVVRRLVQSERER